MNKDRPVNNVLHTRSRFYGHIIRWTLRSWSLYMIQTNRNF